MKLTLAIIFTLWTVISFAQQNHTISGYVKDKRNGEVLVGATIYESNLNKGTSANSYGYYSLSLPAGKYEISYSFLGYDNIIINVDLNHDISQNIALEESSISLEAVNVSAESHRRPLEANEFNSEKLSMKAIGKMPTMLGEPDVIKAIQMQSGIKTLGDGSSAMFVRGGSSDQNLILIDEAPIYNPSHMFGLVSVFTPDAINHVDLYKSNMPAQYGGRVSSVIDCKMKEGNTNDFDFSIGLSPFSSSVSANGPIVKGKSSFLVSGRKSLVDFFLDPKGGTVSMVPAFYDINVKMNTRIGENNRLYLSFYNGKDRIESADGYFNKWGNTTGTLRWNANLGSKMFLNTSFIVSDYQNYMEFKDKNRSNKWLTGINDLNLKFDLSYYLRPGNTVKIGAGSIYHKFIPGETVDTLQSVPRIRAFEHSLFVLNDIELTNWLGLNYGVRLSFFQNAGKATWYDYDENHVAVKENVNKKGVYHSSVNAEPRINVNIKANGDISLKLAYARNAQYMQVLQNNALSYSSLETWFPANPNIKPILVDVVSAGWFQSLGDMYFLSAELYYKLCKNQIDFVGHARLLNNPYIEGETRNGKAKAYGIEINLKKDAGRLTGNISYSYSKAQRKIEDINNGDWYNSPFDIPHDFRINANYKLTDNWSVSSAWMYTSGHPVTLPVGFFDYSQDRFLTVPIYSERNGSRFPDYHRLDLSVSYDTEGRNGKVDWTVNIGLFNVYGRKNPMGYRFERDTYTGGIKTYQTTLFRLLPNFSVKAKF